MTYLDANASEPLRPEARAALIDAADWFGNPASVHAAGRLARHRLETAREMVGRCFGADPAQIIFTSGGTEANALAIHALGAGRRLLIGATEHDSVRAAASAEVIPVDRSGAADLDSLRQMLQSGPPALVCLMMANNETGVLHPLPAAAALCRAHGARLHVDAIQAAGRVPLDLQALGADSVAISSHKLGGAPGAGALLIAGDAPVSALIPGGGQERGRRGGTPALPAIAALAAAAAAAAPAGARRLAPLRDWIEAEAVALGAVVCGDGPRLPNTTCLALPGRRAETQVIALDLDGVQVSAGAACSSGKVSRSHVLAAMGLGPLAAAAIRVSLPWNASEADVDEFARAYRGMVCRAAPRRRDLQG